MDKRTRRPRPQPEPQPIRYAYIWGKAHTRWDFDQRKLVPVTEVIRDEQGVVVEVRP